jgi:flavin reductase (DIM6/NTAB) family NADH-FMN oxidoreductase RutF/rubredoxin
MDAPILYKLPYGLFLITTGNGEDLAGCIVNRVTQITNLPVTIAVAMTKDSHTAKLIVDTKKCILGLLSEKIDYDIITHFSSKSGNVENKFDTKYSKLISYKMTDDMPFLSHKIVYNLICDVLQILDLDTYYLFILKVRDTIEIAGSNNILTYDTYKKKKDEAELVEATYTQKEVENAPKHARTEFVCTVCNYVYRGETPFEDLPDDYKCTVCGANKDFFIEKYIGL